ncbi:MAG: TRAP transporter substrate-binding protein DctP [Thermodesulfobacteriota bacterium]
MKKFGIGFLALAMALVFVAAMTTGSYAQAKKEEPAKGPKKVEKFGEDPRVKEFKGKKWETSTKKFTWRASDPWGGLLFHDFLIHFADSVRACSGGRLDIKVFQTGAIVPAMEVFDAVSKGTLDVGHSWPGYWKGKNEAFVAYASVPFGLDTEGYNIWNYERGGEKMLSELYGRFGMVAFICGTAGQELGIHSNKRAVKMEDFKGMKLRTVGWYQDILNQLGANVTPLPGPEIYLALERGVIDGCEFSSPALNYPQGYHEITKYVIEPGVHQPAVQFDVFINKKKWEELPPDLQEIVKICAKETTFWSWNWIENLNVEAIEKMSKRVEYVRMDDKTIIEFAKTSKKYLDDLSAKNPDVKKALESQDKLKTDLAPWRKMRSGVAPWPYEQFIKGELYH